MNWIDLNNIQQLAEIKHLSKARAQVIFKHSTRCATSSMAKSRLERSEPPGITDFYFLDLIKYRDLSNRIAEDFNVHHASPQVLLIKNEICVYDESHNGIRMSEIEQHLALN